ncbi:hypothetical protein O206_19680 [Ochrobactrum sp. EGD-AQ16]|nr:hypothetical protein O206_19680 [Ochrobactrum sp. EGD-AQ16]
MFKGRLFDKSVIILCVRWYLAYNLSLRDLKQMMAECGIALDHSIAHRWVLHFSPKLLERSRNNVFSLAVPVQLVWKEG